ncbi:substrate-binding periplasmic protein [Gilvimarinus sp. 1_MG-2023]|uniref:substrate-binding periplasmic protein n=1 Tax=Gilvimarinus sp. 1_MG-2023 TaxID=3062638 RepID=UPI0026E19CA2|nr:hypothetical protein [Gilvimarinus sp. 1_MG-2023]MDO6746415.1 hypothetical protein [Gilvimarinus sp. 1_MG-2023]
MNIGSVFRANAAIVALMAFALQANSEQSADQQVLMGTNEASAYSAESVSKGQQGALVYVDCIFNRLPYRLKMQFQPWRRVQQEVRKGAVAGFFTAMPSPVFDQFARLSNPLVLEKWYWFSRTGTSSVADLKNIRTGAILGSHQQQWLEFNGVTDYLAAQDLPQLIKLLMAGRINVILADFNHFQQAAASLELSPDVYQSQFFRYVPLGVYFGHHFLEQNPRFFKQFNQQIPRCVPKGFALSKQEKSLIYDRLSKVVNHWLGHQLLQERLLWHKKQEPLSKAEIHSRDHTWRKAFAEGDFEPMLAMQDSKLAGFVSLWQNQEAYITELIITNRQGVNVAVAPYTSDYWQGDETKHIKGMALNVGQWWFDDVVYDQSTRRFQSQLSLPIDIDDERLGVITIGIDIEKALEGLEF